VFGLCNDNINYIIETGDAAPIRRDVEDPIKSIKLRKRGRSPPNLKELLASVVIQQPTLEWAAPLVFVRKKDGSLSSCIYFTESLIIYKVTRKDAFSLPNIETCIDTLRVSTIMSTLDWILSGRDR